MPVPARIAAPPPEDSAQPFPCKPDALNPPPRHPDTMTESAQQVSITADDGYVVRGTYFAANPRCAQPLAALVNCGAGIPARHYRRFAEYLASVGIAALTYDYRGIGLSRPQAMRHFTATIEDWAEHDCRAAIDWLRARCPDATLVGIGHSVGGVLFGGAPNAHLLARFVMLGAHTGYYGDYRRTYRLPMALLWHGVMPTMTALFGYFPARMLRLGDDIPKGVAMQWAKRRSPFVRRAPHLPRDRMGRLVDRCAQLQGDALILTFTDDGFATAAGAARVREFFPMLNVEHWVIAPADVGARRLGHFGFFRRAAAAAIWPRLLAHLTGNGSARAG